jgi:hypothetical protein
MKIQNKWKLLSNMEVRALWMALRAVKDKDVTSRLLFKQLSDEMKARQYE